MAKVATSHGKYKGVIVSKTDMRKLKAGLQAKMKDIVALLVKQLSFIGEECIRIARESGSYNDITGNLRSSIGYVVLVDGKPVVTGASSLQAKFPWGVVLIVCAGMKYAAYVEAVHHKDVLTSAELKAESLAKKLLNGLIE